MLDNIVTQIREEGWSLLPEVIPAESACAFGEEVLKEVCRERSARLVPKVDYVHGLVNHCPGLAVHLQHRPLLTSLRGLLDRAYRISFTSGIVTWPGSSRGPLHADWPFNQKNAGRIRAPYPDFVFHISSLWFLTEFTDRNGTILVPRSHRLPTNPTAGDLNAMLTPHSQEIVATGSAGSVLLFDSRLWHAPAPNRTLHPRVAASVRFAPWWLDLSVLRPGSVERSQLVSESGSSENSVPLLPIEVFNGLPASVAGLFRHWVEEGDV